MSDITRIPSKPALPTGFGLFTLVQAICTVHAPISAIGVAPTSPNGLRLDALFHITGLLLGLLHGLALGLFGAGCRSWPALSPLLLSAREPVPLRLHARRL